MEITFVPAFEDSPSNPARCHVPTGRIEINNAVWPFLTPEQQEFVLHHEVGHYRLQTFNEQAADHYALQRLALKKRNSLWNFITSVRTISKNDPQRVRAAERSALQIAAKTGSRQAQQLLNRQYANADGSRQSVKWGAWLLLTVITIYLLTKIKKL